MLAAIVVTMLLGGLWHGAGWTFVAWGAMHGAGLAAERLTGLHVKPAAAWQRWGWAAVTQLWVTLAWVFFREQSWDRATGFVARMFGDGTGGWHMGPPLPLILLGAAAIAHQLTPLWIGRLPRRQFGLWLGFITAILLVVDLLVFSPSKAFIYFKF